MQNFVAKFHPLPLRRSVETGIVDPVWILGTRGGPVSCGNFLPAEGKEKLAARFGLSRMWDTEMDTHYQISQQMAFKKKYLKKDQPRFDLASYKLILNCECWMAKIHGRSFKNSAFCELQMFGSSDSNKQKHRLESANVFV